jgi:hypothetical protein
VLERPAAGRAVGRNEDGEQRVGHLRGGAAQCGKVTANLRRDPTG